MSQAEFTFMFEYRVIIPVKTTVETPLHKELYQMAEERAYNLAQEELDDHPAYALIEKLEKDHSATVSYEDCELDDWRVL